MRLTDFLQSTFHQIQNVLSLFSDNVTYHAQTIEQINETREYAGLEPITSIDEINTAEPIKPIVPAEPAPVVEPAVPVEEPAPDDGEAPAESLVEPKPAVEPVKAGEEPAPVDDETQVYKVAGKELSETEFTEIVEDTRKHYGEGFDKLSDELQIKVIEDRVNLKEAGKAADKRSQAIAAERKSLQDEKSEIESKRFEVAENYNKLKSDLENFEKQKADLEAIVNSDPTKILNDDDRMQGFIRKSRAEEKLESLNEKIASSKTREGEILADEQALFINLQLVDLQASYPDLKCDMSPEDVHYYLIAPPEIKAKLPVPSENDIQKSAVIIKTLNEYMDKGYTIPIAEYYKNFVLPFRSGNGNAGTPAAAQPATPEPGKKTIKDLKAENIKQIMKNFAKKSNTAPGTPSGALGSGSTVNLTPKKQTPEEFAEATEYPLIPEVKG